MTDDGWKPELEELARRTELARRMGGDEKIAKHRAQGKLTVRERIDALLDENTFHEIGTLTGRASYDDDGNLVDATPANFVMGRGRIDGRTVVVGGDDFTVRGGAADASIFQKQVHAERMAHDLRVPIVRLVDGSGGGGSVKSLETERRSFVPFNPGWEHVVANLATVPVVSCCLGSVAGLGAARVVTSHYSVMVKGTSQLFVAGPPVVARLGEDVDKETLGGSSIHTRNGAVDDEVATEGEAFARARAFSFLSAFLGRRVAAAYRHRRRPGTARRITPRRDPPRPSQGLQDSRHHQRSRRPRFVVRARSPQRAQRGHRAPRLDGWPVAILANDPYFYAGGWTASSSEKVTRFVDLADTFHLPVVHFVDNPGFVIGTEAEQAATIRYGARTLAAIYQADTPWCSVIIRKVYGVAGAAHQDASKFSYRFAWPSGNWGSLPLEGGIEAAYKAQLEAADDPEALRAEIERNLTARQSPFKTAEAFLIEEIIDPRETRPLLCEFANLTATIRKKGPRSHGPRP